MGWIKDKGSLPQFKEGGKVLKGKKGRKQIGKQIISPLDRLKLKAPEKGSSPDKQLEKKLSKFKGKPSDDDNIISKSELRAYKKAIK